MWFPLLLGGSAVPGIFSFGRALLTGRLGLPVAGRLDSFQQWRQPLDGWAYWGVDGLGWLLCPLWVISLVVALTGYYYRYRDHPRSACQRERFVSARRPSESSRPIAPESGTHRLCARQW
jgi:hypothetical protein